ncbi:MAG: hypothetical protein CMO19_03890 [Thaumarchaeota archaeon]|nr:hypothetical protein [Nitrososphaerota archaeon]
MTDNEKITVKLKHGNWEVEITCPENQVKQTVENVIGGIDTNVQLKSPNTDLKTTTSSKPKKSTEHVICRDLIELLWQENWFNGEKNLSEVDEELSRRGYHYDKTSISHSLKDLVRENILTRNGSMRNYRYVQKRPPVA